MIREAIAGGYLMITSSFPRAPLLSYLLLVSAAVPAPAQVPAELEARLRAIYEENEFTAKRFRANWLPDGSGYLVLEPAASGTGQEIVHYEPSSGNRTVFVSIAQVTPPGASKPLEVGQYELSKNAERVLFKTNTRPVVGRPIDLADLWLLDRTTGSLRQVASGVWSASATLSPDGQRVAYVRDADLVVEDIRTKVTTRITRDGKADSLKFYGMRVFVGEGASQAPGVRWSQDGQQIAYVQSDISKVPRIPLLNNTDSVIPTVRYVYYSRVGAPGESYRLGIVSATGGETRWLSLPEYSDGVTGWSFEWSWEDDSKHLMIVQDSRGSVVRDILLANAATGTVRRLYRQEAPWGRGQRPVIRGDRMYVEMDRDGWSHIYSISRDGKETRLTRGAYDHLQPMSDQKGGWLYFSASPDNATQNYLYKVRTDGTGEADRVTPADQPGQHSYRLSSDGRWAFHTYSTIDSPPVTELVELPSHRLVRVLESNAELREKRKPWIPRPTEFLKLDIGGGVVMDAWLIKPRDFDPTKKYPVIVYIYGENGGTTVEDAWGISGGPMFHRAMADAGYLVMSIDNRGTPAPKGTAWRRAGAREMGPLAVQDQAAGIRRLAQMRPYVDSTRVGIWGWSGGGSNTLNALFRQGDLFKVGVAVASKPVPKTYYDSWQRTYLGTPAENPEGYRLSSPINYAEGLRGHLLIIHGTGETNCLFQGVELLVNRLVKLGKSFDYMTYPNRNHGISEGEGTSLHVRMLMARHFLTYLPSGPR